MKKINTVIYGGTGSIGDSFFSIVKANRTKFNIEAITCNNNIKKLLKLSDEFNIKKIGFNKKKLKNFNKEDFNNHKYFTSIDDFGKMISSKTDVIVFAISGLKAINLLVEILKTGKKIGIANKECIISLGDNINKMTLKYGTSLIPLDSEHNSIFHLLKDSKNKFSSITITASGGPFLDLNYKNFKNITPNQAIKHPIWKMGKKISVDSSTMMNKALELIEAKYLFNLKSRQIKAIVHPQSIVHALINYENGASTALLYRPNMEVPISTLFFNFNKFNNNFTELSLDKLSDLQFFEVNKIKFPAISIAYDIIDMGGLAPNVFNYLNEILVDKFLRGKISFIDIIKLNYENIDRVFKKNTNILNPNYDDIVNINNWIDKNIYLGK